MYKDNKLFITPYLDVRRKRKKDGLIPLRVRIKFGETTNYYSAGLYFDKPSYEKITKGKRLTIEELNQKAQINAVIKRAQNAAPEPFSFKGFKRAWNNENAKADVFCFFKEKIMKLEKEENYNTAELYNNTLNTLMKYHGGSILPFNSITTDWLGDFVTWMKTADKRTGKKVSSQTTISMYLRCLRSIFNIALNQKEIKNYPFSSNNEDNEGFKIPKPERTKHPLTEDELNSLKEYQPTVKEQFWYDMFMFSYYAGGINIKDIALLKKTNLVNNTISYSRIKTQGKNPVEYTIPLRPEAQEIITRWQAEGTYIFNLIDESMDKKQIFKTIKSKVSNINKVMKSIADKTGIKTPISTYTARHTFASRLAHLGAPLTVISESLQHTNIRTTQTYLGKFPSKEKQEWFNKL